MRFDVVGVIDVFASSPLESVIVSIVGALAIRGFIVTLNDIRSLTVRVS